MRGRTQHLAAGLVIGVPLAIGAAMLAWVWLAGREANPGSLGFRLDDAWIHLVYGRGLLHDGFLAYNDGVPTTGCTSPLWAICLAAVHAGFGRDVNATVAAVLVLGAALHLAGVAMAALLARRLTNDGLAATCAGALLALATPWTAAAYSGMEVTLTGLLLLLAMHALAGASGTAAGVWLAAAALARPECAAVTAVVAILAPRLRPRDTPARAFLARLLLPSVVAGAIVAAHHLWASGSPLPATFHAKSAASLSALPGRLAIALRDLLPGIPPFAGGVAWLALLGLLPRRRAGAATFPRAHLPLLGGVAFLLANLLIIDPVDPRAFYHLRYVLPAVPLLLVALVIGAHAGGAALPDRWRRAPLAGVVVLAAFGAVRTAEPVSLHLHNDVRNINEVQRKIGDWLAERVPPGAWIASSDAGAVRYFSRRPTLDALGLNTPEMLETHEEFVRAHPVTAIVLLPAWFRGLDEEALVPIFGASTQGYTVTSNPSMATQVVLTAKPAPGDSPRRARFVGFRPFEVDVVPLGNGPVSE